jgi:DNA ligase-1
MFKPKALTIRGVHEGLLAIARVEGKNSQANKVGGIKKLLAAADAHIGKGGVDINNDKGGPSEAKFIIRTLEGKMRLGLAEKTVLVSLASAMVVHEMGVKGKVASTEQLAKGEHELKSVFK